MRGIAGTMQQESDRRRQNGVWYAVSAYAFWGMFPLYWKALHLVPATQVFGHRILWSFFWLLAVILVRGQTKAFRTAVFRRGVLTIYSGAALLIGINWLLYVWAVNAGHIVETSLGYFINPLLSVLIGVLFLRERLRIWQWLPVGLAAAGVLYLTFIHGSPPWIALVLASTWAIYGLLKKLAPLGSLYGLAVETGILLLPVLVYLIYCETAGHGAFLHLGPPLDVLMIGSGIVTTIPLLLFAVAVQRIPLSLIGILQYIAPTCQFLIGVFVYGEPFDYHRFVGFAIVWLALIVFGAESLLARRPATSANVPE